MLGVALNEMMQNAERTAKYWLSVNLEEDVDDFHPKIIEWKNKEIYNYTGQFKTNILEHNRKRYRLKNRIPWKGYKRYLYGWHSFDVGYQFMQC
jgi:hypothetical protein